MPMYVLFWSRAWHWLSGAPLRVAFVVAGAIVLRWLIHRGINTVVNQAKAHSDRRREETEQRETDATSAVAAAERRHQRTRTLGALLRSVATFVIAAVAIITILGELGVQTTPLLASAGVLGVALGFGAQSLVKDFLAGVFMIIEDQYGVGDVIDTGEAIGTVEDVSLRVTRLRDANGMVWYIRNGEIVRIGNRSQGWSMAMIDIPVAYDEDPNAVMRIMRTVAAEMFADPEWSPRLLEQPDVAGMEAVTSAGMTMRVFAKCRPGEQFAVPREYRERCKVAFDAAGVRGPAVLPGDLA